MNKQDKLMWRGWIFVAAVVGGFAILGLTAPEAHSEQKVVAVSVATAMVPSPAPAKNVAQRLADFISFSADNSSPHSWREGGSVWVDCVAPDHTRYGLGLKRDTLYIDVHPFPVAVGAASHFIVRLGDGVIKKGHTVVLPGLLEEIETACGRQQ